jgi:metal-responsive CopG/Arc/MetJ family transcriptional regulator
MSTDAMTRITISVPESMALRLDAAARATDRSASSIVRLALRAVLPEDQETPTMSEILHPAVRGAALHQRQMDIERERAAEHARQQARVAEANAIYLRQLESK